LRARWSEMEGAAPPSVPPALLRRLTAQRLQERRLGTLPALIVRELARIASEGLGAAPPRRNVELTPGTRLLREWNGQTIAVDVLDKGFAHAGRTWRSLSEIVRHVTGAHWSGPRFFGLSANG
jgi:sirohydrochlorin ferrochelatase